MELNRVQLGNTEALNSVYDSVYVLHLSQIQTVQYPK